jgi:hypothetical protein
MMVRGWQAVEHKQLKSSWTHFVNHKEQIGLCVCTNGYGPTVCFGAASWMMATRQWDQTVVSVLSLLCCQISLLRSELRLDSTARLSLTGKSLCMLSYFCCRIFLPFILRADTTANSQPSLAFFFLAVRSYCQL